MMAAPVDDPLKSDSRSDPELIAHAVDYLQKAGELALRSYDNRECHLSERCVAIAPIVSFRQPCTSPKNQPSAIRSIVSR